MAFKFTLTKEDKMTNEQRVSTLFDDALEAAVTTAVNSIIESDKFDSLDKEELNKVKSVALQRFRSKLWANASSPERKAFEAGCEDLGYSMTVKLNPKK